MSLISPDFTKIYVPYYGLKFCLLKCPDLTSGLRLCAMKNRVVLNKIQLGMKGRKINKTDTHIDSSISFIRQWITINA